MKLRRLEMYSMFGSFAARDYHRKPQRPATFIALSK
jgi:hypothetical protein